MKLKRAKAYKKLLHQYELNFGFREPYQVLLDSTILQDAYKFKIDLVGRLEKVLGAKVKPMITQCDMRHLYDAKPKNETLILQAKEFERRRCGHHELEEPLSTLECLSSVVDPKGSGSNKHRYVVASNEKEVRAKMRKIPGVPLIYISKSVVLMEPMTSATEEHREREEKSKFKLGLKGQRKPDAGEKRKREDDDEKDDKSIATETQAPKKRRQKGPKQPNPLSMKKKKTDTAKPQSGTEQGAKSTKQKDTQLAATYAQDGEAAAPKKRRRKHKSKADGGADGVGITLDAGNATSP
ncbi:rRNA-processing protein utp23 [Stagonosporopsis vannaccii]|nr:rRNA-processing protein utp23 [Stagonosporopsis vannaccii]